MESNLPHFSFKTRQQAIKRFKEEVFDLLIIGGGITGAAAARDAASRGLKVALLEKQDFAWGTSSRSSKLIHGGLRYLENLEFGLVFESLSERALLLKTAPHLVRPLPFYFPVYRGDPNGKMILGMGMWLYDVLSFFSAPGIHKNFSKAQLLKEIPILSKNRLVGGFRYYDASMWDDALTVETLRAASHEGAAVANYVEAVRPLYEGERIAGFYVQERFENGASEFLLRAHRTVLCAGPWTDIVGTQVSKDWKNWLSPSKGVHLVFDLKRIPVPGAVVMINAQDHRISFVMPRPDLGTGVVIVGTTDGPSPADPGKVDVEPGDVKYLMDLLWRYFPDLNLKTSDILSAYAGVRPLMAPTIGGEQPGALQKISREHHIGRGPGGSVAVAGGKYTTHRKMAEEIIDFTLRAWEEDAKAGKAPAVSPNHEPKTKDPVNSRATLESTDQAKRQAESQGLKIPKELWNRYGAEALSIVQIQKETHSSQEQVPADPEGFPLLAAQLRYAIRTDMVLHLADFYFRRIPLFATRADHGMPWAAMLSRIWAEELGANSAAADAELDRLKAEIEQGSAWARKIDF